MGCDIHIFVEVKKGDASAKTVRNYELWEGNAHSASWFTVAELLAVDYDRIVVD